MEQTENSDVAGTLIEIFDDDDLVLSWRANSASESDIEVLRFDAEHQLLRLFPRTRGASGQLTQQFDQVVEIQFDADVVRWWNPRWHSDENDRGLLEVSKLPDGFERVYANGVGLERGFQGIVREIEEHTDCSVVRIVASGPEGPDGEVFRIAAPTFGTWVRTVRTNRGRGREAAHRVNEAAQHNILAEVLGLDPVEPRFKRSPIINAMTEVVDKGYRLTSDERAILVEQVVAEAPEVAKTEPMQFGRLRQDLELVSLDVLIEQFEQGLRSAPKSETYWQTFFNANEFALQLIFSAPVRLYYEHLHVKGSNAMGHGGRITDFALINPITLSAHVVEIKTPGADLTPPGNPYRGAGDAAVHAPSSELSGAIAQVQSQVASMREHFPTIVKDTPGLGPIDPQDVIGALIIGRVGELSAPRLASFKRYRAGLHGITVLGFDEVLERLRALRTMLNSPPATVSLSGEPESGAAESTQARVALVPGGSHPGVTRRPVARRVPRPGSAQP